MIIISCFALENYFWLLKYGADPPSYELPEWIELNRGTQTSAVSELISMVVSIGISFRKVEVMQLLPIYLPAVYST